MSGSESESDASASASPSVSAPRKRPRRSSSPPPNGHATRSPPRAPDAPLPALSLSILGVEPIDEFIREIADFVHRMILTRPPGLRGNVEVEAKIGVLKDKASGQRIGLPVLVESSAYPPASFLLPTF